MLDTHLLAQAAGPEVDAAYVVAIVSRLLHTTCAAILLGGTVYLRLMLAPAARDATDAERALFGSRRRSWALCVAVASTLLLVSGFYNFFVIVSGSAELASSYHMVFGIKFLAALLVLVLMALLAGKTALAEKIRQRLTMWLNIAIVATVVVFLLGAVLRSYPRLAPMPQEIAEPAGVDSPLE